MAFIKECASCRIPGGKKPTGSGFTDDGGMAAGLIIGLREGLPAQEIRREDLPETGTDVQHMHIEHLLLPRHPHATPHGHVLASHGHRLQVGHTVQQTGHVEAEPGAVPVVRLTGRIPLQVLQHHSPVPVVLRVNGRGLDIKDDEDGHRQRDGQSRAHHVDGREEAVLTKHRPGLLEVNLPHRYSL